MYHLKWPLASSVCVYLFLSPACLCLKDRSSINQSVHLHCLVKFRYFVLNKRVLSKWRNKINTGCLGNYNRFTHSGKQNQGPPLSHQKVLPEVWHIPPAMANMHFFWFHTQWLLKADATSLNGSWIPTGCQKNMRCRKPPVIFLSKLFSVTKSASKGSETLTNFSFASCCLESSYLEDNFASWSFCSLEYSR